MSERPPGRQPDDDAEEARRRFEDDLEVRGEAVPPGDEDLPPGTTHEIEDADGERKIRRRRFSAN